MNETRSDSRRSGGRAKGLGTGVAALAVLLFLVDFVALRGERVATASVSFASGEPAVLRLERAGDEHLVSVDTHRRVSHVDRGRAVKLRLEDPDGRALYTHSEIATRKERYFSFTPPRAGEYRLYVEDNGLLGGPSGGSARVEVFVNDQRILPPLFAAAPF